MRFISCAAEAFLLAAALCVDSFAVGFAYGASAIRIPLRSLLILSVVSTVLLALSLLLGTLWLPFVPPTLTRWLCFAVLLLLGVEKLLDERLKAALRRRSHPKSGLHNALLTRLATFLHVYADPACADRDGSRVLSAGEAVPLALSLSLDGLAAGFGSGLTAGSIGLALLFSLVLSLLAAAGGSRCGRSLAAHRGYDPSWLGGALLILLAILKLF